MSKKIYAPIDNKNLMEDAFEDDVFRDFYPAPEHRAYKRRHLVGLKQVKDEYGHYTGEDGYVDVKWNYGDHSIDIQVLAASPHGGDYETVRDAIFTAYEQEFRQWQCPENEGLVVETKRVLGILTVSFYFENE